MGGIPPTTVPVPPTQEEIIARLIEIGRNAHVPDPHTIYMVEDPGEILPFPSRTVEDNIFHAIPIGHFAVFKFSEHRMAQVRATFYRDREAALEDARARAAGR
jgi:hypothetical protein